MAPSAAESPIWLSHHWPDHYDRCVSVGRQHVCRRCLVLYPAIVVTAALATVLDVGDTAWWAPWLLPLPLAIDWTGEHLGLLRHAAWRQVCSTLLAAVGFGVTLSVHLDDPFAPRAIAPVLTYVVVLGVVALVTRGRTTVDEADWQATLEQDEERREQELHRLLEAADASMAQDPRSDPGTPR